MIYFNGDIKQIQYSGHSITKVYSCGGNLVWSGGTTPPTPPTGNKLTYTCSGDTYYIPCDSSSTLTFREIIIKRVGELETAIVGDCVTVLGDNCFNHETKLSSCTIPNTVTTIEYSAFADCNSLTGITIPTSVTSIGSEAFDGCSGITSVDIPSGVTEISIACFEQCISLSAITIPSGVTTIGRDAFYFDHWANPLEAKQKSEWLAANRVVTIHAVTPPTLGDVAFSWSGEPSQCTYKIYVPAESVTAYQTAWPQYADRIEAIP